jgi:hypothetical protein
MDNPGAGGAITHITVAMQVCDELHTQIGRQRPPTASRSTPGTREHMPDAVKSFGAEKAWRYWSLSDPAVHQATYQFPDTASLDRATNGEEMKRLVADFNRDWPDVTRTREIGAGRGIRLGVRSKRFSQHSSRGGETRRL